MMAIGLAGQIELAVQALLQLVSKRIFLLASLQL